MGSAKAAVAVVAALALICAATALALPNRWTPSGLKDFTYGPGPSASGGPATAFKPESKLFYTPDRRWWAVLGDPGGVRLYALVQHVWKPRLRMPGADPWAKADVLFDRPSRRLFVAVRDNGGPPRVSALYRLSYRGRRWKRVGRPTPITRSSPETLTIARDARGRLWTAWVEAGSIVVGHTAAGGTKFSYSKLPAPPVSADDIAAVVAFGTAVGGGRKIGVMWSDQNSARFVFAWRLDRSPPTKSSWHLETAYGAGIGGCPTASSPRCADDHISLKAVGDEVFAAVKTSLNDAPSNRNDPLVVLLRRIPTGGWNAFPVSPVVQNATRPIVLLAPGLNAIWVFATIPASGVYVWESAFTAPAFNPAAAAPWTTGAGGLNDPTSTKQLIARGVGAVVETSLEPTHEYWHNEFLP